MHGRLLLAGFPLGADGLDAYDAACVMLALKDEIFSGTDMTVNENGNNSQVYPAGLQECTGVLADGLTDRWYEYVPAGYDGSKKVPLVVSNHGGLMNGWAQAVYSSWTLLAERVRDLLVSIEYTATLAPADKIDLIGLERSGIAAVLVRGCEIGPEPANDEQRGGRSMIRPREHDLFR